MALRDIVVGLDSSQSAVGALQWASALAEATAAQVRILSTWHMPVLATIPSIVVALPPPAVMAAHVGEQVDKALGDAGVHDVPVRIAEGDAGAFLAAETSAADLVVIGRTGSGQRWPARAIAEFVLGSSARYCLHHASGPVALIPATATWVSNPRVVVGIDGSPASLAALRWALESLPASARIHAIQAIPPYREGLLALDHNVMDRLVEATQVSLDETVTQAVTESGTPNRAIATTVVVENARYALTKPAFDADMIVVGARGNRLAARTPLLGSTSDHVVRRASCPVVVIPSTKGSPE